jgi:hypothetical protein
MASALAPAPGGRGRLPVQTRDRRAALSALALLLVVAGALGSALVVYRSGQRTDVLVAAHQIKPGQQMAATDFGVARVATDSGSVVHASDEHNFIGTFATTGIPTGTMLNHLMFQVGSVLPAAGVVVGVTLSRNQRPAADIVTGDVVRAFLVPRTSQNTSAPTAGPVLVAAARVVDVQGASSADTITVSLLVGQADAQLLISAAGQGTVALAELPKTTVPPIDFQSAS